MRRRGYTGDIQEDIQEVIQTYRCRAENKAGVVDVTAQLIIHEVPRVRLQPEGSVVRLVGSRLSITCSVTGDPAPSISWKRMSQ